MPLKITEILMSNFYLRNRVPLPTLATLISDHLYFLTILQSDMTSGEPPKRRGSVEVMPFFLQTTDSHTFFLDEFYVQYLLIDAIRPSNDTSLVTKGGSELAFSKKPNISNDAKWSRTTHFTNLLKSFKEKSIMININP